MSRSRRVVFALPYLFLCAPTIVLAAETSSPGDSQPNTFTVHLIDPEGRPVAGAAVGLCANWGDMNLIKTGWEYASHPGKFDSKQIESDGDGLAQWEIDHELFDYFCVVARNAERKLVGLATVDGKSKLTRVTLSMRPECRVHGRVTCKQLEANATLRARPDSALGIGVSVFKDNHYVLEYWSKEPTFECFLPPGDYTTEVSDERSWTHRVKTSFSVKPGQETLELPAIDRPLAKLKLLEGQLAPELPGVLAWKNSKPLKLADLKGRPVLLDFWGYWCGACVSRMPELFELHDKYHDRGLVIIGVHVDLGDDDEEKVDTPQRLDKRIAETRKELWHGRDIPFPVALVSGNRHPYGPGIQGGARSAAAAEYGVQFYPTQLLIDPDGRVAGAFYPSPENIKRLEELLVKQ